MTQFMSRDQPHADPELQILLTFYSTARGIVRLSSLVYRPWFSAPLSPRLCLQLLCGNDVAYINFMSTKIS